MLSGKNMDKRVVKKLRIQGKHHKGFGCKWRVIFDVDELEEDKDKSIS